MSGESDDRACESDEWVLESDERACESDESRFESDERSAGGVTV
ncbi:hypothetical protein [Bhargavaea cecembensis]|nr:hypothetical protein [Bhargavaea cecembensis]